MTRPPGTRASRQRRTKSPERLRLREAPLAAAALMFAAGILEARFVPQPPVVLAAALGLLALVSLLALALRSRAAFVPVLAVWAVLGMAAAIAQPSPVLPLPLLGLADTLSRTVVATVVRVRALPPPAAETDADVTPPWEAAETTEDGGASLSLDLALSQAEQLTPDLSRMVPVAGDARVTVYLSRAQVAAGAALPALRCGDTLELPLRMRPPERFRNPGQFQYADYLLAQGIAVRGSVAADQIRLLGSSPPTWACRLAAAQAWSAGRLDALAASPANHRLPAALRLGADDAHMLSAMLFGDRTGLSHPMRTAFERTGSFHLFVVSGLHIGLVAGALFFLLRRAGAPPWLATAATLPLTAAYAALTGLGMPAERALGMTTIFLLARLLSRDASSLNALGAATLAMLLWSPSALFEAGLQMTLLAIVAIAGIAVPLGRQTFLRAAQLASRVFRQPRRHLPDPRDGALRLRLELWGEALESLIGRWPLRLPRGGPPGRGRPGSPRAPFAVLTPRKLPALVVRALCWTAELALIGAVTELVMVLPMAFWFHRTTPFALPANLVVIPVLALLIPAAVLTFAASLVGPGLAAVPGAFTAGLLHAVSALVARISRLPSADLRVPGPALSVAFAAVLALLGCCWLVRRGRTGALLTAGALPLIALGVLWPEPPTAGWMRTSPPAARPLELTALDVGQGDSLLAVNPDGQTMLIDAGGPVGRLGLSEIVANFDLGEQVVAPYLWSRRIRRLDIVVLTHAHTDHMGGMPAILRDLRPRELWVGYDPESNLYRSLLAEAAHLGITVRHLHAGDRQAWGPVAVSVLSPSPLPGQRGATGTAAVPRNDDSLVLELRYGHASVLLEGDAERPAEDAMLAAGLLHPVTLLKVGHHGSHTSSNPEFLAAVQPQFAIVSVGRHNPFGHPRGDVLRRFADAHTTLYRTDLFGLTTFLLTPDGKVRAQTGDAGGGPQLLHSTLP